MKTCVSFPSGAVSVVCMDIKKKKSQFLNSSINCTNVQKGGVYERASRVDFYNYDFFIYKILKIVQFPKYFGYLALENRNYISWPSL